jgi:hypothetical protein
MIHHAFRIQHANKEKAKKREDRRQNEGIFANRW